MPSAGHAPQIGVCCVFRWDVLGYTGKEPYMIIPQNKPFGYLFDPLMNKRVTRESRGKGRQREW